MQIISKIFQHKFWQRYTFLDAIFFLIALFVAIRYVFVFESNNYKIFYYSLTHLQQGESLYTEYPLLYFDHFLYSPVFSAIFSFIFLLPYKVGLFIWPFLFTGIWVLAVRLMPIEKNKKIFIYWYALQELFTAIDNSQTNPLIAAIPLLVFIFFENKKPFWAAALIILGFNIKIYSLVTGALFLLYPQKIKFLLSCLFWLVVMALIPLVFTTPEKLYWQYNLWINQLLIKSDHDKWLNQSFHRVVHTYVNANIGTGYIILFGVIVFCSVYIHYKKFTHTAFKMLFLSSILIFHVIFNPAAESATYITAITGVAIWWNYSNKTLIDKSLLIFCYIFTVLSPTEFMPKIILNKWVIPYVLKAMPCVLIWFRIIYSLHTFSRTPSSTQKNYYAP